MRALILTAGLGTRLRPLTRVRAKAAVPVNGEPLVRRVIRWLVRERIADLVLNLHHLPASIAAVVGDGRDLGARVRYSWEDPVLGSAGGPRRALPLLLDAEGGAASETAFLLVNGDTLTEIAIGPMLAAHRASGALVTLALTRNPRPDVYGGVLVRDGRVTGFSRPGAVPESFHFVGVQIAEGRAFAELEDGVRAESINALYPRLIDRDPGAIAAHVVEAPFRDVGTPADYVRACLELADIEGDRLVSTVGTRIDPAARLRATAVWDHVTVEAGAALDHCIVCDDVVVPAGTRAERCAIVAHGGEPADPGEEVAGGLLFRRF